MANNNRMEIEALKQRVTALEQKIAKLESALTVTPGATSVVLRASSSLTIEAGGDVAVRGAHIHLN